MRVKCILCDKKEELDDENPIAKRLRNRPIHTYMCMECTERIAERTTERHATGKFNLYRDKTVEDEW
ncbi:YlaI family protein [Bacillus sp. DX4.1]|uniref:YlaI family protein n=1 Tax=Bacillus sp. DX4.1 TaxID=3055867 RepID=UPI0025A1A26B|nr:YlaI family protein [Bacillus sp. DX4.1]MDM5189661.1 YlaI family protein [Bacillus sp. DX4.1]